MGADLAERRRPAGSRVFQFSSDRRELELVLPAAAAKEQLSALLDGKRVAAHFTADELVIPLTRGEHGRHLLELEYQFPERPRCGLMSLELPRLADNAWVRRCIGNFLPATSTCWRRPPASPPNMPGAGLAGSGAANRFWIRRNWRPGWRLHRIAVPDDANQYVFSAFGDIDQGSLYTAGRSWIVLVASGAALWPDCC